MASLNQQKLIKFTDILDNLQSKKLTTDADLLKRAYVKGAKWSTGKIRISNEPVIAHLVKASFELSLFTNDEVCIAGGLLHEVIDYGDNSKERYEIGKDIFKYFSKDLIELITNVAKHTEFDSKKFRGGQEEKSLLNYPSPVEQELERNMLFSKDPRILLIMIADCIDNTRDLKFFRDSEFIKWYLDQNVKFRIPTAKRFGFLDIAERLSNETLAIKHRLSGEVSNIVYLDVIDIELYRVLTKNPELIRSLDWRVYEKLLADILETFGYEIELQRGTKDGGVDIFAVKRIDSLGPHRYLLQAKRWSNRIGIEPVRQLLFLHSHHRVTKSCLATTSFFTKGALELANQYKWQLELRDYEGIKEWINKAVNMK